MATLFNLLHNLTIGPMLAEENVSQYQQGCQSSDTVMQYFNLVALLPDLEMSNAYRSLS